VAAAALVDQWGSDRDAFYVVAWSLDAGYSADQIIDAAPHGMIQADGTITDTEGAPVEPVREPEGLLVAVEVGASGMGVLAAAAGSVGGLARRLLVDDKPRDAQVSGRGLLSEVFDRGLDAFHKKQAELQAQAEEDAAARAELEALALEQVFWITRGTLELAARGYSAPQIIEAILLDQWAGLPGPSSDCWYFLSASGVQVIPDYAPVDPLLELECAQALEESRAESQPDDAEAQDQPAQAEDEAPEAEEGYTFHAYLDLESGFDLVAYEWVGTFQINEGGDIIGDGVVHGTSIGTCSIEGADRTSFDITVEGSFQLEGEASGSELKIRFENPTGQITSQVGDESVLCVDVASDIALGYAQVPLGADDLGGPIVVPTEGGSITLDVGGIVIEVTVTPA
jgi:hypothetical protein